MTVGILPGSQVAARGLRWEVVYSQPAGEQLLYRLRCLEGGLRDAELDLLSPFEPIEPIAKGLEPERAAPLPHWRLYMRAFLLEQALGPGAFLAAQPGRLEIQPYQLVPVMRALRMSRPRLLLADGVGLGKTVQEALALLGIANAFAFDFLLRLKVQATVKLFILDGCPVPRDDASGSTALLLAHSALRLSCNHAGYAPLWREQVGEAWREDGRAAGTWPVVEGDDARWLVRAAIDAVVAEAYGLTREQYAHVLASFSHKRYPKTPEVCLAAFDELKAIGLEAFCRKHDPYWDIPLNENLPEPVIELPIPEAKEASGAPAQAGLFAGASPRAAKGRKPRAKRAG